MIVIERPLQEGQPRRKIWCSSSDVISNGDGTYRFVDFGLNDAGFGSKVEVIDAKLTLLYDNNTGLLHDWSDYLSGGEVE